MLISGIHQRLLKGSYTVGYNISKQAQNTLIVC